MTAGDSACMSAFRLRGVTKDGLDAVEVVLGPRASGSGLSWEGCSVVRGGVAGRAGFISRVFCARKLLKNWELSDLWTTGVGFGTGSPRANAREEEEDVIPGGGGVGYDMDGTVR